MCQEQIIKYLTKIKHPVDINELCRVIPANRQTISRACQQMDKYKEIRIQRIRSMGGIKFLFCL